MLHILFLIVWWLLNHIFFNMPAEWGLSEDMGKTQTFFALSEVKWVYTNKLILTNYFSVKRADNFYVSGKLANIMILEINRKLLIFL